MGGQTLRGEPAITRLEKLPEYEIIKGLRGTIDFACNNGVFYARAWPRYTGYNATGGPTLNQGAFGYIKQQALSIDAPTKSAILAMIDYSQRVFTDEQVTLYFGHDSAIPTPSCWPQAFAPNAFDNCSYD